MTSPISFLLCGVFFVPEVTGCWWLKGGVEGLEILRSEPVDLVISDMRMPHMDGVQFLKAVKQEWPDAVRILDGLCRYRFHHRGHPPNCIA